MAEIDPLIETDAPSTTTAEQNRVTFGQRRINMIWEMTQAIVTLMVTGGFLYSLFVPVVSEKAEATLNNVLMVVVTFYFVRTNHQRVGGVPQSIDSHGR